MDSVLTKSQKKKMFFHGADESMIVTIRYDDECGNGHNTFSITAEIYGDERIPGETSITVPGKKTRRWMQSCGCLHDEIIKKFPELAKYIKFHLCSTDGPMHYVANTIYHASDKDCWGLRKGEKRQIKRGGIEPAWILSTMVDGEVRCAEVDGVEKYAHGHEQPPAVAENLFYAPWYQIGKGKEPDIEAARHCAIWPDATPEQLTDKDALTARLPELMAEFQAAVIELGFTY